MTGFTKSALAFVVTYGVTVGLVFVMTIVAAIASGRTVRRGEIVMSVLVFADLAAFLLGAAVFTTILFRATPSIVGRVGGVVLYLVAAVGGYLMMLFVTAVLLNR